MFFPYHVALPIAVVAIAATPAAWLSFHLSLSPFICLWLPLFLLFYATQNSKFRVGGNPTYKGIYPSIACLNPKEVKVMLYHCPIKLKV